MAEIESHQSYDQHVGLLKAQLTEDAAVRAAIGGQFSAVGLLQYHLLISLGLGRGDFVIDVGCGSGRLACHLATLSPLSYLGTDVVQELLDYAEAAVKRAEWNFRLAIDARIPCEDGQADFVCFFSVFTHLTHNDTFRYLTEAKRVLKPGGKIVFSFLEFRIPCHWDVFDHSLKHSRKDLHLNQFMDREGIQVWAQKLGLAVDAIADGDRPHIPIPHKIQLDNGQVMENFGNLGQSVAVLSVPRSSACSANYSQATPVISSDASLETTRALPTNSAKVALVRGNLPPTETPGRFICVSARGYIDGKNENIVVGFVVRFGFQFILARAIGPGLAPFGISNFLHFPKIEVQDERGHVIASNAGVQSFSAEERDKLISLTTTIATFATSEGDAALAITLLPGAYTLNVFSLNSGPGIVLAEIYELPSS